MNSLKETENKTISPKKILSMTIITILIIAGGCIGVFVFLNLSSFLLHKNFLELLTGGEAVLTVYPQKKDLSKEELDALKMLINNGRVLTQDQLLGVISSFYNSIINALTVVISLLGVLAYFSIRSLSKNHAEQIAEKHVSKEIAYYLSDETNVSKLLNKSSLIRDLTYSQETKSDNEEEVRKKLEQLESRLMGLEYGLMASQPNSKDGKKLVEEEATDGNNPKK